MPETNEAAIIELLRPDASSSGDQAVELRDAIAALIDAGTLEHGARLPVERRLAETLGLPRLAVRRAYEGLERRGAAQRKRGSGTYVTSAKVEGNLHVLSGLGQEVGGANLESSVRVIEFGYHAPEPAVARALEIDGDSLAVVRLVRVRTIDGAPGSLEVSWMPASVGAQLLDTDLRDASLFALLAETRDIHPDHATEQLQSVTLDGPEAALLETATGSPAFLVHRTTYTADGAAIEYAETLLRGDRFYYATTLQSSGRLAASAQLSRFETMASK